jgi:L-histidine N-alpha-methyltransferase
MRQTPAMLSPRAWTQTNRDVLEEVLNGLQSTPKVLSPVWLYDEYGSLLFDRICELPEYYLTRTELAILRTHIAEMAELIGPRTCVIEPGSGASVKTRLLLERLDEVVAYVPIDISREHLDAAARQLRNDYPHIEIQPVCADFTRDFSVTIHRHADRNLVFFPGSTLGNFATAEACGLLASLAELVGDNGSLLVGIDLRKDLSILLPAYDDAEGVTAEFNRNALRNVNRAVGAEFVPERFTHRAAWNEAESRIEMQLISRCLQAVQVGEEIIVFEPGEPLITEYSHKYTLKSFATLARAAGLQVKKTWLDDQQKFSVQLLQAGPTSNIR